MKKLNLKFFFSTLILVSLVVGCFNFVNPVNASTSTGFKDPSSTSGTWSYPERAYDDGGTGYAISDSAGEQQKYGGYGFSLPSSVSIVSVTVRLDTNRPTTVVKGDDIKLEVSVDGGTTFLATSRTIDIIDSWHTYTVDVTSWTSWTVDKINNDKIWVRVTHVKDGLYERDVYLDWIPLEVTYDVLTTTTTSLSESSITLGASVTCTANVIPTFSSLQPTGIVTFYAQPDGGLWSPFDSKTLTDGSATSNAYTPTSAGTWYFRAVYGGDSYFADSSSGETDDSLEVSSVITYADSDWPMFRGDPTHSGYSTSTAPSTTPTLWSYDTKWTGLISSPAVVDDVVYIGSNDNSVYALDAATGATIWSYWVTGTTHVRGVSSSPAVVDGVVYVGSDYVYFYALDATTGALKWRCEIGSGAYKSSPVVDNGVVYIGSTSGGLYALEATTGALRWSYATGGATSSPAVVDGVVYVGSGDFNVYAFNALTGALKWSYPTGYYVYGSPAVVDGVVYIGSTDNKVYALDAETGALKWSYTTGAGVYSSPAVVNGVVYIGSTDYKVYALDAATGAEEWIYTTGGRVESSPAVANGVVYVGSDDWSVYGLDASTGAKLWSYPTGSPVRASPAFANGVVYISAYDGQVFAINAGTSVMLHLTVNSEHGSPTSTSTGDIGQGTVVTVSVASIVNGPTGVRYVCTGWTGTGSVPASGTGTSVTFTIMEDSSVTWNWKTQYYLTVSSAYDTPGGAGWYDTDTTTYATLTATAVSGVQYVFIDWGGDTSGTNYLSSNPITMNGPKTAIANWVQCNPTKWIQSLYSGSVRNSPAVANNMVYVGASYMLFALDATTGTQQWLYHTGATSGGVGGVRSSPTVLDGVVYCGSDGPSRNVYALNAVTGAEIWTYNVPGGVGYSSPAVANGVVYIGSSNCNLYALDAATGAEKWVYTTGAGIVSSPAVVNGVVYIGSTDYKVYALDASTGALKWSYTTGHQVESSPTVVNGVVYIGSVDGKVYALDAANGAFKWSFQTGGQVQSKPTVANGVVYVGSGDGNVYALNAATGVRIWSQVTGYVRSSPAVANGVVYVSSLNRNIYAFDASTGETLWCYATGDGVRSSPVVVDGIVYVGSYDGKVYAIKAGKWRLHLAVTSAYGSPTPATGDFCQGTVVTESVASIVNGPTGVRYLCTGWTGTGSVPASGTGTSVTFTIMEDSSITWNWKTQYQVTFAASPSGGGSTSPSGTGVWNDAGPLSVSASANSGYVFSSWSSSTQSITFNNANSASTTATLNGPGTVTANFIVTNHPPVADANGPYNVIEGSAVNLDASGSSDPDGSIVLYEWDLDNDGSYDDATGITTSYTWLDDGVYTVGLRVTDNDGISDTDTATVTVSDLSPTAGFSYNGPQDEGSPVQFTDASTSSPDTIVSWSWDFAGLGTSTAENPSFTFMDDGVYTVRLTVTDEDGSTDTVIHDVTVSDLGPTAGFSDNGPQDEGESMQFTDSSTSSPDTIVSWSWDFGDGGSSSDQNPSHTFMDDGVYTVRLTVTDDDGSTDYIEHSVTVNDLAPTAGFSDNGPQDEGSVVSFTDASTSYPDPIVSWSWDFGDGGSSSDQNPSHTFMDDGVYTVRLTVTDEDGSTDTVSHDVTVSDLGPTAAFDWSPKPQDEGSAVSFTDSSSSYPDTIVSWSWDFAGLGTSTAKNPSFTFMDDGVYTVRLTVTDEDGSTDTVIHDVAVNNVAPTLYSIGSQSTLWGEELYFDANAYDPGDDVITFSLEGTIPLGAAIDSDDGEFRWTPTAGQVGTHTFTVKVTDDDEEYDEEEITVTVGKRATTLVYNGDSSEQYSDETSLSATLSGEPSGMTGYPTLQGNTITFTIGTQSTSGTTNTGGVATALLVINQASGSYTVESEFAGDDYYLPSSDSDPYIINKETAIVSYTGSTEVSTAGTAVTEAAIRLAATVTEAYDGYVGNLALAKVVFTIAGTTYESKPFREVIGNVPVDSSGNALATAIIPAGAYTIDVDIESSNLFWESEIDSTALLVDIGDGKQTVSGGGWIPSEDSINGKINFAFTVQYNKKGDPKGSFVAVFKSTDGFIYKIKSTSWAKAGLSFTDEDEAFFTCTGVVQKIDRATGEEIESWGNAKVMVDVKDGDVQFPQNGGTDTIAITVTDNSYSVLFQWGTKAEPITIGGGNITVKNTEEKVVKTK